MAHGIFTSGFEQAVGILGLFLILLVTRLADSAYAPHHSAAGRLAGFLARRGIDAIGFVGRLADHIPAPAR